MKNSDYERIKEQRKEWERLHPPPIVNQAVIHGCKDIPIIKEIIKEMCHAKIKHPAPWQTDENFSLLDQVVIMVCEAGEALQAANKLYYEGKGSKEAVFEELRQTAGVCIRILLHDKESEFKP